MSNTKFAIIVSYRDRAQHLRKFLPYMKARFKNADIFIVEQEPGKPFNRGKLLNIGILEAGDYPYFALHDVDMLPVQANYSAPVGGPTLLATKASQFGYKMPYPEYFSGVILLTKEDLFLCNGYHNEFWGWAAEDNHFRDRVLNVGLKIQQRDCTFNSLPHERHINQKLYQRNCDLWKRGPQLENGLTNCEYKVLSRKENHLICSI